MNTKCRSLLKHVVQFIVKLQEVNEETLAVPRNIYEKTTIVSWRLKLSELETNRFTVVTNVDVYNFVSCCRGQKQTIHKLSHEIRRKSVRLITCRYTNFIQICIE